MRRSDKPPSQNRIDVIELFRAIAILAVLLFHYTFRWGPANPDGLVLYNYPFNLDWFQYGWLGVYLFFVISGFVIFMTVQKCRSIYDFALRRLVRLYPIYLVCMTLTFVIMMRWGAQPFRTTGFDYLVGLSMQSANFGVPWVDGAYWSLLVEMKFYFWIAVLYFFRPQRFVPFWCLLVAAVTIAREFHPYIVDGIFSGTNLAFFTAGIGFYKLYQNGKLTHDSVQLFLTALAAYIVTWRDRPFVTHIFVLAIIMLFTAFSLGRLDWLKSRWLLFVGAISYPLYLVHQFIGVSLLARLGGATLAGEIGALVSVSGAMVVLAWLLHRYVEVPFHELGHASIRRWRDST